MSEYACETKLIKSPAGDTDQWVSVYPELVKTAIKGMRGEILRSPEEFAEQEIRIESGKWKNTKLSLDYMPFQRLVLRETFKPRWKEVYISGAVQSGKTTIAYTVPILYYLFEMREELGMGIPTIEMGHIIFKTRIMPTISATRYREFLPKRGAGSRGGKSIFVQFENGGRMYFFPCGGGEEQRSSYSCRVVALTEIENMTPEDVAQIRGRTEGYGDDAKLIGECTVTTEDGIIWQKMEVEGSGGRIWLPCPHCGEYQYPDRKNFRGWENAENIIEAMEGGRYVCEFCGAVWSEDDRLEAQKNPALAHRGQTVAKGGEVVGDLPPTNILGIRWNAMLAHPDLRPQSRIAELEWRAAQSESETDECYLAQKVWCIPFQKRIHAAKVTEWMLAKHCRGIMFDQLRRGVALPERLEFTVGAIDVQKRVLYWQIDGFAVDGLTRWTLCYGVEEIVAEGMDRDPTEVDVRHALDAVAEIFTAYDCASSWVDTGYRHEGAINHVVRMWCNERGGSVHALVGRGEGHRIQSGDIAGKALLLPEGTPGCIQAREQKDGTILWLFNVDELADELHARLFREWDSPGYHHFPEEAANDERTRAARGEGNVGWIFRHYMRVKKEIKQQASRTKRIWEKKGRHDLWDTSIYILGGAFVTAADIREERAATEAAQPTGVDRKNTGGSGIRTKY